MIRLPKGTSALIISIMILVGLLGSALILMTPEPTAVFMQIISVGAIILLILSLAIMLLTFRKAKRVSPAGLLISVGTALTSLVVYSALLKFSISAGVNYRCLAGR